MRLKLSMPTKYFGLAVVAGATSLLLLVGCTDQPKGNAPSAAANTDHKDAQAASQDKENADIQAERAKLSPEDQRLVAAQEFCAISNDERLGAMGPPVKIVIKGQPVFLCCHGCEKKGAGPPGPNAGQGRRTQGEGEGGRAK